MPKFWMISNRQQKNNTFGSDRGPIAYWTADQAGLDNFHAWTKVTASSFQTALVAASDQFPLLQPGENENQNHVCFFVHGFNNGWEDAARRYEKLCDDLFSSQNSLGLCISFDWPSYGNVLGYFPDRNHARECASDLTDVLSNLYDWLLKKQKQATVNPANACRAKVSMIAHSMGNFLLQKAMSNAWTRKNQPLLSSLINQLVMVAADVDNDLFEPGSQDANDGNALSNLTYRVSALYSGRDAVLGASAGLKHFGTRRLGRSGLAINPPTGKDNIWDVDCSSFFPDTTTGMDIHSAYFENSETLSLIRSILCGIDRNVLEKTGQTKGSVWP